MKPRSGLGTGRSFSFFASIAKAAESVRALSIVSSELSPLTSVSLQLRIAKPTLVAHPDRSSFEEPPSLERIDKHLADEAFLPTHSALSAADGRRETEYMRAASEETATASSSSAINSSPMTNPRRWFRLDG